jgi:hypothetical protein
MTTSNDQTYEAREEAFLAQLTELTKRYRIKVGGCGCCGSPYLDDSDEPVEGSYRFGGQLMWQDA